MAVRTRTWISGSLALAFLAWQASAAAREMVGSALDGVRTPLAWGADEATRLEAALGDRYPAFVAMHDIVPPIDGFVLLSAPGASDPIAVINPLRMVLFPRVAAAWNPASGPITDWSPERGLFFCSLGEPTDGPPPGRWRELRRGERFALWQFDGPDR